MHFKYFDIAKNQTETTQEIRKHEKNFRRRRGRVSMPTDCGRFEKRTNKPFIGGSCLL